MYRRNWLDLSRKLVDITDMDFSFNGVQNYTGQQALAFFGEGVAITKTYPNPFIISMSGTILGGTVGYGIAFDPNGQITSINPSTLGSPNFTITPSDPTHNRWDLLVLRYNPRGDTLVPKPSDPLTSIDLNIHDDFTLAVIAGTPSASPAYPAKGANDIILAGLQVGSTITIGTSVVVDLGIRETAIRNGVELPVVKQETPSGLVNGSNTVFTLSQLPISPSSVIVIQDGLALLPSEFSVVSQTVTLTTAPAFGQTIYCFYVANSSNSINPIQMFQEVPTGAIDGTNTIFSLAHNPIDQNSTAVYLDGTFVPKSDWSLLQSFSSSSVVFSSAPAPGQTLSVVYFTNLYTQGFGTGVSSVTNAANVGTGADVFKALASGVLQFKTLAAGANVMIADDGSTLTISSTGGGGGGSGAYATFGTFASPTAVTASSGISLTTDQRQLRFIVSTGGMYNITANPQISIPGGLPIGAEITLVGTSDSNAVTFSDGTGLSLNGAWQANANSALTLVYDGSLLREISRR